MQVPCSEETTGCDWKRERVGLSSSGFQLDFFNENWNETKFPPRYQMCSSSLSFEEHKVCVSVTTTWWSWSFSALFFLPLSQHFFTLYQVGSTKESVRKRPLEKRCLFCTQEKKSRVQLYHSVTHKIQYLSLLSITWLWWWSSTFYQSHWKWK